MFPNGEWLKSIFSAVVVDSNPIATGFRLFSICTFLITGENSFIMEEQLILSLTLQNPQTDEEEFKNLCKIYDQCLIQCDDENLNRVLNVPNFEKNEVFEYPNFWFIFYAWIIGATACNGVAALQDAIGI